MFSFQLFSFSFWGRRGCCPSFLDGFQGVYRFPLLWSTLNVHLCFHSTCLLSIDVWFSETCMRTDLSICQFPALSARLAWRPCGVYSSSVCLVRPKIKCQVKLKPKSQKINKCLETWVCSDRKGLVRTLVEKDFYIPLAQACIETHK